MTERVLLIFYLSWCLFSSFFYFRGKRKKKNAPEKRRKKSTQIKWITSTPFGCIIKWLLPVNRHSNAGYCTSYTPAVRCRSFIAPSPCCVATVGLVKVRVSRNFRSISRPKGRRKHQPGFSFLGKLIYPLFLFVAGKKKECRKIKNKYDFGINTPKYIV